MQKISPCIMQGLISIYTTVNEELFVWITDGLCISQVFDSF